MIRFVWTYLSTLLGSVTWDAHGCFSTPELSRTSSLGIVVPCLSRPLFAWSFTHLIEWSEPAPRRSSVQGRPSIVAFNFDVRPGGYQRPNDRLVPAAAGMHERSPSVHVLQIQLYRVRFHHLLDNIDLTKLSSPTQCTAMKR